MELTNGEGADAVLECVGTEQAVDTAVRCGRPGATVGRVGVPHNPKMDMQPLFYRNTRIAGGPASVTTYDKQLLLDAVLKVKFTRVRSSPRLQAGRHRRRLPAMDQRQAIKSYVIVD